jgi:hypothetical protein
VASSDTVHSFVHQYPARMAAIVGAALLALGAVLGSLGQSVLLPLAVVVLLLAAMAGLGSRGVKEYEAYRRSGMEAVDGMTGALFRQQGLQSFTPQHARACGRRPAP